MGAITQAYYQKLRTPHYRKGLFIAPAILNAIEQQADFYAQMAEENQDDPIFFARMKDSETELREIIDIVYKDNEVKKPSKI